MDYVLDAELAAIAPMLPVLDLSDVQGVRELTERFLDAAPRYESQRRLSVEEVGIPGYQGAPDVSVRVYTPDERTAPIPGLHASKRSSNCCTSSDATYRGPSRQPTTVRGVKRPFSGSRVMPPAETSIVNAPMASAGR